MSAPVPPFVPYKPGASDNEFDSPKRTNGAQNLILRIKSKSSVPAGRCSCAADAIQLEADATLLEAAIQNSKPLWRRVVKGAGDKAQSAKRKKQCKILVKPSSIAIAVTAPYSVGGIGFRFAEPLQPGYLAKSWQQEVHWCDNCCLYRIEIEPHVRECPDKHSLWDLLVDDLEREPGTVFIDELFVNLQKPAGEEECARDVRKLVTWVPPEAAAATVPLAAQDAAHSHVLAPSAAWHERKFEGKPGTLDIKQFWFYAIQRNNVPLVDQLWSYKPDVLWNANFPAHYKNDTITALQLAVTLNHTAVLQQLLSYRSPTATYRDGSAKPSFNPKEQTHYYKTTVLHKAAHYCNKQLVQLCLDHDANPLIPSKAGSLPHHICAFRACEQRRRGNGSRFAEYMAIARLLLRACENPWYRGCKKPVVVQHADVCGYLECPSYDDEAKAFLQEAVRLNAEETAAAAAVATPTAVVPAAAAAAAAAVVVQPDMAASTAAAAVAPAAGTVRANITAAVDFDSWSDDSSAAAVGGSSSSAGVSFTAMLQEAQGLTSVIGVQKSAHSHAQYSTAALAACAQTALAHDSSTATAAAARFGDETFAATAAAAATAFNDFQLSNAQQQCELSGLLTSGSIISEDELDELDTLLGDGDTLMQLVDDAEEQTSSNAPTEVIGNTDVIDTASSTARSNKRLRPSD